MARFRLIYALLLLALMSSACSVTRHIPNGEYLLSRVKIEDDRSVPRKERIKRDELAKYIRQTPNKRFLGTNIPVWLYESADSTKQNGWNNWKRRMGQEPVLLNMSHTERSEKNLKVYLDSKGYFRSTASYEVDTTSRPKRAKVTYRTHQGPLYRIKQIGYRFEDEELSSVILADTVHTLLKRGEPFDISVLDAERERVTLYLKEQGYYNFTVGNIAYIADTLGADRSVDLTLVVQPRLTGYNARGEAMIEPNIIYRLGRVNIYPDYTPSITDGNTPLDSTAFTTVEHRGLNITYNRKLHLRPSVLRQAVSLTPQTAYSVEAVNRTYSDLMALGYFRTAKISFTEQPGRIEVRDTIRIRRSTARRALCSAPPRVYLTATSTALRCSSRARNSSWRAQPPRVSTA